MKLMGIWTLTAASAMLLLSWPVQINAEQSAKACGADEIHWTIDEPYSISFDWRGEAPAIDYGLTPAYGQSRARPPRAQRRFHRRGHFARHC